MRLGATLSLSHTHKEHTCMLVTSRTFPDFWPLFLKRFSRQLERSPPSMNAMSTEMRGIRVRGLPRPAVAGAHNAAPLDSLLRSIRGRADRPTAVLKRRSWFEIRELTRAVNAVDVEC